jgi:FkbM family methyltransferase
MTHGLPNGRSRGYRRVKEILQHAGLASYGVFARTGIMKQAWARRVFLAAYSAYKAWIEARPVDRLRDFVPPGSTVVDVGANIGFFTLKFARWVGEQGQVIAIEPDLENFETLAAALKTAGLESRVRLHQAAAAAEGGSVRLRRNELHPGDHRIAFGAEGIVVPAVTVDDLVAGAGARTVSLVKIDVQGAEMLVFEGAKRTLGKMRPALFVEVDDRNLADLGSSAHALIAHLEQAGYEMHELAKDGPPRKLSHDGLFANLQIRSYIDVLFLPGMKARTGGMVSQSCPIGRPGEPAQ